jgi:hypothetical protein
MPGIAIDDAAVAAAAFSLRSIAGRLNLLLHARRRRSFAAGHTPVSSSLSYFPCSSVANPR